ncbi:hypothetical protein S7711_00896 [Stachybotrys chartarum IBT 7711]|uniref:Uncharacterized protein n=1 Tax=Stachybotrys chartarum (strain CBS 109288 / IBT 7711) TaxID=1280523 RepID=A0A084B0J4_STACB|nr:hypothetical protein S7711_00896 [Stachybotrys chartarum IBT 7711]
MANTFDRLERLFTSRRKPLPVVSEATAASSDSQPLLEQTFPAPSFIRPTGARMAARDEVSNRQLSVRYSSAGSLFPQRMASLSSHQQPAALPAADLKPLPTRLPSLIACGQDSFISSLTEIINASTPNSDLLIPTLSTSNSSSSRDALEHPPTPTTPTTSSLEHAAPLQRLETLPSSASDDQVSYSQTKESQALILAPNAPPTPEPSPELRPMPDACIRDSEYVEMLATSNSEDVLGKAHGKLESTDTYTSAAQDTAAPTLLAPFIETQVAAAQSSDSHAEEPPSSHARQFVPHQLFQDRLDNQWSPNTSPHTSLTGSTLYEPDFNDFLNLSDDDIAEDTFDGMDLRDDESLPSIDLSISSLEPPVTSLMTLSPPRSSRPATAAAFEAARIASRYDFDLVYVVSLWPDIASIMATPSELHSLGGSSSDRPLAGRLLAAHGLHHVPSPLQISSTVHSKILCTEGWTEYRNRLCEAEDLARGYACAFYKGSYARNRPGASDGSLSSLCTSEHIERGIVFAAYRKPRSGPNVLGPALTAQDLGNLHGDAEALVEMLMDFHVASRIRHAERRKPLSEQIGPIPSGRSESI